MSIWQIIVAIALAALSAMAIGLCLYAIIFDGRLDIALVAAVILLAMAQLISFFGRAGSKRDGVVNIKDLMQANDSLSQEQSLQRRRLDRMENVFSTGHTAAAEQLDAQVQALEHSVTALTRQRHARLPQPGDSPQPAIPSESAPREIDLFLEPVVRVAENRTAYYRASLAVRNGENNRVPVANIARAAEQSGFLGELDLMVFERTVPVIRRFQSKRGNVGVFCPVSASSFADDQFVGSLLALLKQHHDIAGALVIEISQATLSILSDKGQEGLAYLAELGATFALSDVRADVPDLTTLGELGFSFICADVRLLIAAKREGRMEPGSLLVQAAHGNMSVIAANVVKQDEFSWIQDTVSLAYGPYFSPPRLVRHEITVDEQQAKVA